MALLHGHILFARLMFVVVVVVVVYIIVVASAAKFRLRSAGRAAMLICASVARVCVRCESLEGAFVRVRLATRVAFERLAIHLSRGALDRRLGSAFAALSLRAIEHELVSGSCVCDK